MGAFWSNGATLMIVVLLVLAIAYRYYSAFIAAKVLALDGSRTTPAHELKDGHNYHPTNKWVLFGHHFAAISGAGPLIGPVLAAQFGYMPSLLWILVGVCLAGAVQDFIILALSTRRKGKSLAQIAYSEVGPVSGTAATIGILFVLVIAIAGLGKVVTKALGGETVTYAAGTQFLEAEGSQGLKMGVDGFEIPRGAKIVYPNKAETVVTSTFVLRAGTGKEGENVVPLDVGAITRAVGGPERVTVPASGAAHQVIAGSSWGTFTIALTIPIALFVGVYLYRIRKGRVVEASIIGGVLTLVAVYLGGLMHAENISATPGIWRSFQMGIASLGPMFNLEEWKVGVAIAVYGFVASVLPVWMLLCPRDYLSSFLKIGTVILLIVAVLIARPHLQAPAFNTAFFGGGPVVKGAIFPFLFITVMCGAVSGFHSLVSSGTTPKMINNETDARMIGYGAMLIEGLVGIVALVAASSLSVNNYYAINTAMKDIPTYQKAIDEVSSRDRASSLDEPLPDVGEHIQGRTGGAVTLAVGMAKVMNEAVSVLIGRQGEAPPWLAIMYKYWYHFAIMFEALFILTTIDTGTRVGRFLLQETMGKWVHPKLGQTSWWPSAILATALISFGWWYFLHSNAFDAIWAMFGMANQMLAVMALAVGSACIARSGKMKYVWVTLVPMCFVIITTGSAAVIQMQVYVRAFWKDHSVNGLISALCLAVIVICTGVVVGGALVQMMRRPDTGRGAFPVEPVGATEVKGA